MPSVTKPFGLLQLRPTKALRLDQHVRPSPRRMTRIACSLSCVLLGLALTAATCSAQTPSAFDDADFLDSSVVVNVVNASPKVNVVNASPKPTQLAKKSEIISIGVISKYSFAPSEVEALVLTTVPSRSTPIETEMPTPKPQMIATFPPQSPPVKPTLSPIALPNPIPTPSPIKPIPATPRPVTLTIETPMPAPRIRTPSRNPTKQPIAPTPQTAPVAPINSPAAAPKPTEQPTTMPTLSLKKQAVNVQMELYNVRGEVGETSKLLLEQVTNEHVKKSIDEAPGDAELIRVRANVEYITEGSRKRLLQQEESSNVLAPLLIEFVCVLWFRSAKTFDAANWIVDAFSTDDDRALYLETLKNTGDPAFSGVEDLSIFVDGKLILDEELAGSKDDSMIWIIIGAVGGVVLLLLLIVYLYCRRKGKGKLEDGKEATTAVSNTDAQHGFAAEIMVDRHQDDVSTLGDPVFGHGAMLLTGGERDERTASVGDDYDYAKQYLKPHGSTEESARSPLGLLDSSAPTRQSFGTSGFSKPGVGPMGASVFSDDASFEQQYGHFDRSTKVDVVVPPGKLGMVIDTPNGGVPVVHAIKSESVLADRVHVGDRLISVDGEDVTGMTAVQVSKLISLKSDQQRLLVFVRNRTRNEESIPLDTQPDQ